MNKIFYYNGVNTREKYKRVSKLLSIVDSKTGFNYFVYDNKTYCLESFIDDFNLTYEDTFYITADDGETVELVGYEYELKKNPLYIEIVNGDYVRVYQFESVEMI